MTDLLCRILRGESHAWRDVAHAGELEVFEAAEREGVHVLLALGLRHAAAAECPPLLRRRLESALRGAVATEQIVRREVRDVLAALDAEGVSALVFKGTSLAFTHYVDPVARPRLDTDIIVSPHQVVAAARVFDRLGYRRPLSLTSELVGSELPGEAIEGYLASSQIPYSRTDRYAVRHDFDLHWKLSTAHVFTNVLSMAELMIGGVPVRALGDGAKALGPVHALVLACMHRVGHHHGKDCLIWLYDIHLLASAFSEGDARAFVELAIRKQISAVCAEGLGLAQDRFHTTVPPGLLEALRDAQGQRAGEPSAAYVRGPMRRFDLLLSDLAALESWSQRARLLRQHVLPPASYMRRVYGSSRWPMALVYAWRFLNGARGWFRSGGSPGRDS